LKIINKEEKEMKSGYECLKKKEKETEIRDFSKIEKRKR
jgi:hypothetical protein